MQNDDFLKEKQDIREKMLRYSRAIKEGKKINEFENYANNDDILRKRNQNLNQPFFEFQKEEKIVEVKQDLINVKLKKEEKTFSFKLFSSKKNKKQIKKQNNTIILEKKAKSKGDIEKKIDHNVSKKVTKEQNNPEQKAQVKDEKEDNTEVKNTLLDDFKAGIKEEKNLSFLHLILAMVLIIGACAVFIPQIYIRNNIYYISREIAILRSQESILSEENKELNKQLETMRFQNQILDFIE